MVSPALADPIRVAYWQTELAGRGPGVMLRDIRKKTPRMILVGQTLANIKADILVLGGIDFDHDLIGLTALKNVIGEFGLPYEHMFSALPNSGIDTGLDIDGDGRLAGPRDAQGFGNFPGEEGMAVLSRWPIELIKDHTGQLWKNVPHSQIIDSKGRSGGDAPAADIQRLSSKNHWELQVHPRDNPTLTLMIFHATPPVFDGPEDRNGRRNADEIMFWVHRLDGALGPPPDPPFLIMGTFNLDPEKRDGKRQTMQDVLADMRIQDPPALSRRPTAEWPPPGPGSLRVDYILPSSDLGLLAAKVGENDPKASHHFPIWVDIDPPAGQALAK